MLYIVSCHGDANEKYFEILTSVRMPTIKKTCDDSIGDGKPYSLLLGVQTSVEINVVSQKCKNGTPYEPVTSLCSYTQRTETCTSVRTVLLYSLTYNSSTYNS